MPHEGLFEAGAFGWAGVGDRGGGVGEGRRRGDRDREVEFAEERAREVRVLVAAFEDDAVEFLLRDRDGPVRFLLAPAGEPFQQLRVEYRHPAGLAGGAPMLQDEQDAGRVVDAGVAAVGEEDAADLGVVREGDGVLALADFVALDVFDRVEEFGAAVAADGAVSHGEDVVAPGGAGYGRGRLLAVDAEGGAVEGEDADVVCGGRDYDVGVAESDCCLLLAGLAVCC